MHYISGHMYYILSYDVKEKRVGKALKVVRRYLTWVQNSVFEGELTESRADALRKELATLLDFSEDSVIIFAAQKNWIRREVLGREKNSTDNFV